MRAILALLILVTVAPTAQAASYSVPARGASTTGAGTGTVALAAGQVVWVEERGTGAALVAAGEDGVPRDVTTLPPVNGTPRFHSVAASGTTAFLQRHVCATKTCRRAAAADLVRVDLTTGTATPFDGCLGLASCRACPREHLFNFGLRGDVLGITGLCTRDDGVIDLATGETRRVPSRILAAAGPYAATSPDDRTLIVSDWRTGATVTRVDDVSLIRGVVQVALDADGTLAWAQDAVINVLAPGSDRPRTVPRERDQGYEVALAGGRLATRTGGIDSATFQVDDRTVTGPRSPYGWAFDGSRLAWAAEPCGDPVIQVWDLATDPPPPPNDRCIRARLVPDSVRLGPKGAVVSVRLRCPPAPARGCAGEVAADLFAGSRLLAQTGWWQYRVPAGETRTQRLRVERRGRLRGQARLVARVKVDNSSGRPANTRRRVRG